MSGPRVLDPAFRLCASSLVSLVAFAATSLALGLTAAQAQAQSAGDTPETPGAPAQQAPAAAASEQPAPTPSEAAPPSQAQPNTEPAPAATAPEPTAEPTPTEGATPKVDASASAAFAPVSPAPENTKPHSAAPRPAGTAAAVAVKPSQPLHEESAKDDADSGGLFGPFRIGVLVGTGLPEVVSFGAQLKLTRFFGAGVNVGLIPTVKIKYYGEAAQKYQEYDAYGHIYPFGGSFFFGAGVGYAQIDGTLINQFRVSGISVDVTSDATVRTLVLTPQIGFLKIFDVGFAIGFDIGAQIPIAPSQVEFNTVAVGIPPQIADMVQRDYINPNDEKVRHTLDTLGRTPLPTFNLKIGWFL